MARYGGGLASSEIRPNTANDLKHQDLTGLRYLIQLRPARTCTRGVRGLGGR
jgi:hypothetical protein